MRLALDISALSARWNGLSERALRGGALALAGLVWLPEVLGLVAGGGSDPAPAERQQPRVSLAQFEARPLFAPSRRPQPGQGSSQAGEVPGRFEDVYVVKGVVSGFGRKVAIVQHRVSGRFSRIDVGADFEGYRLDSIEPDRALFRRDGGSVELPIGLRPSADEHR